MCFYTELIDLPNPSLLESGETNCPRLSFQIFNYQISSSGIILDSNFPEHPVFFPKPNWKQAGVPFKPDIHSAKWCNILSHDIINSDRRAISLLFFKQLFATLQTAQHNNGMLNLQHVFVLQRTWLPNLHKLETGEPVHHLVSRFF